MYKRKIWKCLFREKYSSFSYIKYHEKGRGENHTSWASGNSGQNFVQYLFHFPVQWRKTAIILIVPDTQLLELHSPNSATAFCVCDGKGGPACFENFRTLFWKPPWWGKYATYAQLHWIQQKTTTWQALNSSFPQPSTCIGQQRKKPYLNNMAAKNYPVAWRRESFVNNDWLYSYTFLLLFRIHLR